MSDFTEAYKDIHEHMQEQFGNVPVYRSAVPTNVHKPTVNGMFQPYVVLSIGGGIEFGRSRNIVSPRHSSFTYWVTIVTVAPDDEVAAMLKAKAMDILTGYVPVNSTELIPHGGQAQSVSNENRIPPIYQHRVMFKFIHNMVYTTA